MMMILLAWFLGSVVGAFVWWALSGLVDEN